MSAVMDDALLPAWEDAVDASQITFRHVLDALAEPGAIHALPTGITGPQPLMNATTALCLALLDFETPVWCDPTASVPAVAAYLGFHCGCPMAADAAQASFAIIADPGQLRLDGFAQGSMEYPDRSTTLLVQVPSLVGGSERTLSGPGIPETRILRVAGLPGDFDQAWRANATAFPLGVDIVFCCGDSIVGLPRTTQIHG